MHVYLRKPLETEGWVNKVESVAWKQSAIERSWQTGNKTPNTFVSRHLIQFLVKTRQQLKQVVEIIPFKIIQEHFHFKQLMINIVQLAQPSIVLIIWVTTESVLGPANNPNQPSWSNLGSHYPRSFLWGTHPRDTSLLKSLFSEKLKKHTRCIIKVTWKTQWTFVYNLLDGQNCWYSY